MKEQDHQRKQKGKDPQQQLIKASKEIFPTNMHSIAVSRHTPLQFEYKTQRMEEEVDEDGEIDYITGQLRKVQISESSEEDGPATIIPIRKVHDPQDVQHIIKHEKNEEIYLKPILVKGQSNITVVANWLMRLIDSNKQAVKKASLIRRVKPVIRVTKILSLFKPSRVAYVIVKLDSNQEQNILFSTKQAKKYFPIHLQSLLSQCLLKCNAKLKQELTVDKENEFLSEILGIRWRLAKKPKGIKSGQTEVLYRGKTQQVWSDFSSLMDEQSEQGCKMREQSQ